MKPNHLIGEKSPYLLQHAYNPVDWRPWGDDAFLKAGKEDKPILLSIGYSTCHWCHVMERESFSDPRTAEIMNRHFVCVKVDREERPDVDRIYMAAVQALTGSGGWPLNVFLTPDLKPFFGGTYFPPQSRWGMPGFPQILENIARLWKNRRQPILGDSDRLAQALKEHLAAGPAEAAIEAGWLDAAFRSYESAFDPAFGGFGGAPKFPMPVHHNFLLRYHARAGNARALEMVRLTLARMAAGGVYDQIGGGFHRYSTDAQWRVPHFEKMLYDNAQLAVNYLEAHQATGDPDMARVARETLDYVLREMTSPEGAFYSAEDADSLSSAPAAGGNDGPGHEVKREGAFYLWTRREFDEVLGGEAALASYYYGVRPEGNALSDPHGEFRGENVLYVAHGIEETAKQFGVTAEQAARRLASAREALSLRRSKRPRPGLDDKVLAAWNGLMISALAKGSQALGERKYLEAAEKSARFMRARLYDPSTGRLSRRWRDGERAVDGMADDYAFLIQGLLDLYESSFESSWLRWAEELAETQIRLLGDGERGGFFMTAAGSEARLIARVMDDSDNVEPSANSVSTLNLLRLAQFTGRPEFGAAAERTMRRFGPRMSRQPLALPQMLAAVGFALSGGRQVVIAGEREDPRTQAMIRVVHRRFLPDKTLILLDNESRERMGGRLPFLKEMRASNGTPTAYVCRHYSCRAPAHDADELARQLDA